MGVVSEKRASKPLSWPSRGSVLVLRVLIAIDLLLADPDPLELLTLLVLPLEQLDAPLLVAPCVLGGVRLLVRARARVRQDWN